MSLRRASPAVLGLALASVAVATLPGAVRASSDDAHPQPVGQRWTDAPSSLPPDLRTLLAAGEHERALTLAGGLAMSAPDALTAAAAWAVVGVLHREAGRHNLASEAFTRVRRSGGPLAPLGAWFEAEQDLARGRADIAARECADFLTRWPEHPNAEDCTQLIPFALARAGDAAAAADAAAAWDAAHEHEPIGEAIALENALHAADRAPRRAIPDLQRLAVEFRAPLVGRIARTRLALLREDGHADASVPDDTAARTAFAVSLRETGQRDAAWEAFAALAAAADDDPDLARWIGTEAEGFGWSTRRYDMLATGFLAELAQLGDTDPDAPAVRYAAYRALDRAGRHAEALVHGLTGLDQHPRDRRWRGKEEVIGRTALMARDYAAARDLFDRGAGSRGGDGVRNRYFAAFAAQLAEDPTDALARWDALLDDGASGVEDGARYWRARVLDGIDPARATRDRAWIVEADDASWYALWLRDTPPSRPHGGRWSGPRAAAGGPTQPPTSWSVAPVTVGPLGAAAASVDRVAPGPASWSPPRWAPVPQAVSVPSLWDPEHALPHPTTLSPAAAAARASALASAWGEAHPELAAAVALGDVGLVELAGPMLARFHRDLGAALRARDPDATALWRALDDADWWALFLHTGDHHHMVKVASDLLRAEPERSPAVEARLRLPLAHTRSVWRAARTHDVDPFLVLGIMRTESLYDATAVSYAGARGPMQIMPRTGHLMADLTDDVGFTVSALHDPAQAVDRGVHYLSLLLDRFDGVFPLAVASYNGGPHNVSSWMHSLGPDMPLDLFVEHMPFGQTRRYTRKVTETYARYVLAYGPPGAGVVVPPRALGDNAAIIDF